MTIDDLMTIDVDDIVAIQLECAKCRATLAIPPGELQAREIACANCSTAIVRRRHQTETNPLEDLAYGLRTLAAESGEKGGLRVRLQIRARRPAST